MPRPPRLHVPGGFYHVTLRGNHRQAIFTRSADRILFSDIVREAIQAEGARLHAYCWMTNHVHLLLQVSNVPLGRIMLRIASRYSRTVQARVPTTGHLFERRYHAVLVDADAYLLTVIRYIHNNPLTAGLVKSLHDYRWSSHAVYCGTRSEPWVTKAFGLGMLSADPGRAAEVYRTWMHASDIESEIAPNPSDARVVGGDPFLKRLGNLTASNRSALTLEDLVEQGCRHFAVQARDIASASRARQLAVARAWIAHRAIQEGVASICEVARRLQRNEASVRGLMLRHPIAAAQ